MSEYPVYQNYKKSEAKWLGDVPTHWREPKLSYLFAFMGSGTTPKSDDESYYGGKTPWVTTGELREGLITSTSKTVSERALSEYSALKLHPIGSIIIAMYGATIGRVAKLGVEASTNQACCVFPPSKSIDSDFLYLWLMGFRSEIVGLGYGGGQPNISQGTLANLRIALPNMKEQKLIVSFLNDETTRIDTLIKKKARFIELLKEKRQALISHAVTKGLDASAPIKDSGIDWLGDVPEHWDLTKLKYIGKAIIGLTYDPSEVVDVGEGIIVLRSTNIQDKKIILDDVVNVTTKIPEKLVTREGDILICSRNGSQRLIGKNAIIAKDNAGLTFGAFTTIFRCKSSSYVYWILNSQLFDYQSGMYKTTTINQLTTGTLNNFNIPLPSSGEQLAISNYLTEQAGKIDLLVDKTQQSIALLKEHRTALISAAVTGKIDVRNHTKNNNNKEVA